MPRTSTLLASTALVVAVTATVGVIVHQTGQATARQAVVPVAPPAPDDPGPTPVEPKPARGESTLSLDGHDTPFPAANLTVTRGTRGLHAILCTDDPPAALDAGYDGHSFMFDMRIPADRVADLVTTAWDYNEATSSDATGIFLHGDGVQLQPTPGVRVTFQNDGPNLMAVISGPFIQVDRRDPSVPPKTVQVYGCVKCLPAEK